MNKLKNKAYLTVIALVAILAIGSVVMAFSGSINNVENFYEAKDGEEMQVGSVSSPYVYSDMSVFGQFKSKDAIKDLTNGSTIYATTTLGYDDSGTTYLLAGTGTTIYLPAVAMAGVNFRFVISGASAIGNWIVSSALAEGDNIEGSLIVAGAVVDCDDVDAVNFVVDGENLGDYVQVVSDGTNWLLVGSNALTATKMTCTG